MHIIVPQGHIHSYSLRLAVNASVLDANITFEHAAHKLEDTNQMIMKFRIGKTCLIAYANSSSLHNIIRLEARVTKLQTLMVLVTTAVSSAVVTLLVILACIIVTGCCCLVTKLCNSQLQEYITIEESMSEYVNIQ